MLNNDRVIQLESGRLIVPVAIQSTSTREADWTGRGLCYLSDDHGQTWERSRSIREAREEVSGKRRIAQEPCVVRNRVSSGTVCRQEPCVVQLRDGRVMMSVRYDAGSQWMSFSSNEGQTWSKLKPSTLRSPVSPATIERIPATSIFNLRME